MKLNPSQSAVAASREKRLVVLAGAGSGKTATCVHWVAGLVRDGIPRGSILMITFTRKAASEMRRRVDQLTRHISPRYAGDALVVGTYHAVASTLLRKDATKFGLAHRSFSTLDESEAHSIWKSALKQAGIDSQSKLFSPSRLHALYSLARNTCRSIEAVLEESFVGLGGEANRVVEHYERLKRAANSVDYDDLLMLWLKRMEEDPQYAAELRARWKFVLVDEMQDNNRINQAILDALAPEHLMVVGDSNQSIYGFRGADASLIIGFTSKHPDAKVLKLEDNYRSGQKILDVANRVVEQTASSLRLKSAGLGAGEGKVSFFVFPNAQQEAAAAVAWIQRRIGSGKRPCECAILTRSSRLLTPLEVALNQNRIRYKKYGGLTLADASEVKDFIGFLRLCHNPHDKVALLRVLTMFPGIGEGTAAKAVEEHTGSLFANAFWPRQAMDVPRWLEKLEKEPSLENKGRQLKDFIQPLILANYPKDAEERLGTLDALVNSMGNGEKAVALEDFLDGFALSREIDEKHPGDSVILSTIHSSKGLEWDGVWLLGAGSAQMPHPRVANGDGDFEEEKRLLYVAVTRAREHLVLSYSSVNDRKVAQLGTPFLEGVDWLFMGGHTPEQPVKLPPPKDDDGPLMSRFRKLIEARQAAE